MSGGPRLVYQRWLEFDAPAAGAPMWSWPVRLSDGRTILTLLYRPLAAPGGRVEKRTVLLEVSADGEARPWGPGQGYPAPVIFYANERNELYGFDLTQLGRVYVCRPDGAHVATLAMDLRMGNLVAPEGFVEVAGRVWWVDGAGAVKSGVVRDGGLAEVRGEAELPVRGAEVRFPHTHVTRGWLYVLDFDPMARVSAFML